MSCACSALRQSVAIRAVRQEPSERHDDHQNKLSAERAFRRPGRQKIFASPAETPGHAGELSSNFHEKIRRDTVPPPRGHPGMQTSLFDQTSRLAESPFRA